MGIGAADSVATMLAGTPGERAVPFGSNSLQHGTAVFEGIRCYRDGAGSTAFRLDDHLRRLLDSARALGVEHHYDLAGLRAEVLCAVAESGLADAYVRPVLYTPQPRLGVDLRSFEFALGVEIWAAESEAGEVAAAGRPVRLTISPWRRPGRSSFPVGTKATGLYALSALAKTHAVEEGYDDAVQLDPDTGLVAEATIANVFLVRDGVVRTPSRAESLLPGITRDSVLILAAELGYPVAETPVEPAELTTADEVFLTGTAIGLQPVAAVGEHTFDPDRPVFTTLHAAYRDAARGRRPVPPGWRTPIPAQAVTGAGPRGER